MNTRQSRTAFSLVELMLVIALIAVLMSVVVINAGGYTTRGKTRASMASMSTFKQALQQYNADYNAYPPTLQYLMAVKLIDETKPLKDGWAQDFFYSTPGLDGKPYVLISLGEDKLAGTPDDIDLWTMDLPKKP